MRTTWTTADNFATEETHSGQLPSASDGSDGVPRRKTAMAATHDSKTSPSWSCVGRSNGVFSGANN